MHNHENTLKILNCSKATLSRYTRNGRLNKTKKGRNTFYNEHEVAGLVLEIENNQRRVGKEIKPKQEIELQKEIPFIATSEMILDAYGLEVLADVTDELTRLGLISTIDRRSLEKYAIASQQTNKYILLADSVDSIMTAENGAISIHPYHKIMCDYQKIVSKYEKEFGLTPLSRQKLTIKEEEEFNEFDEFCN